MGPHACESPSVCQLDEETFPGAGSACPPPVLGGVCPGCANWWGSLQNYGRKLENINMDVFVAEFEKEHNGERSTL